MAADSAWRLGGLSAKELGQRVWREFNQDEILDRSAALSYYFLGAIFPLLLVLFSILGLLATPGSQIRETIMRYANVVLPGSASGLIQQTLDQIMNASGGGKISFGILLSIWSASAGVVAVMSALNVVYDVRESRNYLRVRATAIGLMLGMSICILLGSALALFGGSFAEWLGNRFALSTAFVVGWKILQFPIALVFILLTFDLIYYFAPDDRRRGRKWWNVGAITAVVLWLLVSFCFRLYLHFFNSYSVTYGSLGALIILMLWFYFTGLAILIGGEINSELEQE